TLKVDVGGRAGGQLEHAAGPDRPPNRAVPGRQISINLPDPLLAVEKDRIDREPHEKHGYAAPLTRVDPHAAPGLEPLAEHQTQSASDDRARHLELLG